MRILRSRKHCPQVSVARFQVKSDYYLINSNLADMKIGEFVLENPEKVERAINGSVSSRGQMTGGVEGGAQYDKKGNLVNGEAILAEYDRLGGYITMDGYKVKTGSFWDLENNAPIEDPKPILLFNVNGDIIEFPADEKPPIEVRAAQSAAEKKAEKKAKADAVKAAKKAASKKGGKKAAKAEEPEESDGDEEEDSEDEEDSELA